jgi:hypothetical protein
MGLYFEDFVEQCLLEVVSSPRNPALPQVNDELHQSLEGALVDRMQEDQAGPFERHVVEHLSTTGSLPSGSSRPHMVLVRGLGALLRNAVLVGQDQQT